MTGPENYKSIKEAVILADQIKIKVGAIKDMLHDIDPDKLDKFVKLLRKTWKFSFLKKTKLAS